MWWGWGGNVSHLLCSGYIQHCSIEAVSHQIPWSSILLEAISQRSAVFLFWIFVSTKLSSSVNCPSLMLSLLSIILRIDLSVTLEEFHSIFLKSYFHICIHSSWLAFFNLAFKELFFSSAILFEIVYLLPCCDASKRKTWGTQKGR